MEALIALAIAYAVVAPDGLSLALTRGAAGAASAIKDGRPVVGGVRSRVRNARRLRARGGDFWSRTRRAYRRTRTGASALAGALIGAGRAARAGKARTENALVAGAGHLGRGWRWVRDRHAARRAHPVTAGDDAGTTTTDTAGTPPVADAPPTTAQRPETAEKGHPMTDTTIPVTELDGLDAVDYEIRSAVPMLERLGEALTEIRDYATGLADRWAGTEWGTRALDEVLSRAPEAAEALGSVEALLELMTATQRVVDEARGIGEVAAEQGAYGTTEAFTPR